MRQNLSENEFEYGVEIEVFGKNKNYVVLNHLKRAWFRAT